MSPWQPWDGSAGGGLRGPAVVVAVVVHWTCTGDRDGQHPEEVLGIMDIALDSDAVHWSPSEHSQPLVHDGVPAYALECDLCSTEAIIGEDTARAFLLPLREQYLAGQRGNVTRVPLTALSQMPTRRRRA